jgi:predicted O-methyltransferase YrrM/ribosomal protein S21
MKDRLKQLAPPAIWLGLRSAKHEALRAFRRVCEAAGFVVARRSDYFNPLPSEFELRKTVKRWNRPSSMTGVHWELSGMKDRLSRLAREYLPEFTALPPYAQLAAGRFGPGFPHIDAFVLYAMIRSLKPKRYLEVGSGLSTYYCSLARERNASEGSRMEITCIEPFPFEALHTIRDISLKQVPAQEVPLNVFEELGAADVLFIDSSHTVRVDGEVPYLFLEVLPRLQPGVHIHIHDIPFPFNTPFPAEFWVLTDHKTSNHWPAFFTEAMLIQAFLAFNPQFQIALSCPLLRHFDEPFLRATLPFYQPVSEEPNTFSSLWLARTG